MKLKSKINKEKLIPIIVRIYKFLHSSLVAFITNLVVLTTCVELLNFPEPLAYALAVFSATSASFLVCRYFVFKHSEREKFFKQYWKFVSSSMVFRIVEFSVFTICVELLNFYYFYVFLVVQTITTIIKFFFYKKFIFKDPKLSPDEQLPPEQFQNNQIIQAQSPQKTINQ